MDAAFENNQALARFTQRSRQVHTITDRYSTTNTYLINDESVGVVDPGSEINVLLTLEYLQRFLKRSPGEIDLIILTHLHPDHMAGVETLRRVCKVPVAASSSARELAFSEAHEKRVMPGITHLAGHLLSGALHHLDLFPPHYASQMKLVDVWLEDVAGLPHHPDWRVIATPGHTAESLCLYNPFSYELLCGDTVITLEGGAPLLRAGANRRQLEETLRILRSLEIHYLYPGHGRPIIARRPLTNVAVEW